MKLTSPAPGRRSRLHHHRGSHRKDRRSPGRPELAGPLAAPLAAPLSAPTPADAPARPVRAAARPEEPDAAWEAQRHLATSPTPPTGRRRNAWRIARAVIPVVIVISVGAGALMMLTNKVHLALADRASQSSRTPAGGGFAGYPGQQGRQTRMPQIAVSSVASAGGVQVAVGSANGHPAIWRRSAHSSWSLVSAATPAVYRRPGTESLTGVVHGPAGWVATGDVISGAAQHPVVVTSADGVTWGVADGAATFSVPGLFVYGAAAGKDGYVIVGKQVSGGQTIAAMWWSADLKNWVRGNTGRPPRRPESRPVYGVAATSAGFAAVGSDGTCHTFWSTADGRNWTELDVPRPAGLAWPVFRQVAQNGTRLVATGDAVTTAGPVIPLAEISLDGGATWHNIALAPPGTPGSVTALTAAGTGWVAAGEIGPPGEQHAVTWSSRDGIRWTAGAPAGSGAQQIDGLLASGSTVTATGPGPVRQGARPVFATIPAP
ncbi:MAG: hypothetical protein JOY82_06715 [Streptosporangiaceae bacterium]|nr:hypothetical protein [Streptosporangiaceae bacterium]